ncbi:MAG: protein-L-isoaspartate(D-aspartate) O-methyltransferase [Acidobacteria bacterium]|nr:protein-L-isoaspartate(D-aspartate) O-methyltransferase [Acidobacteriota bacterium]
MEPPDNSTKDFLSFLRGKRRNGRGRNSFTPTHEWIAEQQRNMVEYQLRCRGIVNERVLEAMRQVPRHEFVPPEQMKDAYEDRPLPIGQGQTISQPYMVAAMVEALELKGTERVLEVGTGSGYQAAVLARLAAQVYTIEFDPVLAAAAQERLAHMGLANSVVVVCGDGSLGYALGAHYDGIIVAAAAPEVPEPYLEQLVEGGRLVIPVGSLETQELRQIRKVASQPVSRFLGYCRFVPLRGERGWKS